MTFCKDDMSSKSLVLELWPKNITTHQNAGFFELQYLTKSIYELEFLYVVRHLQKQQIFSDILSGYGQACLDMLRVIPNIFISRMTSFYSFGCGKAHLGMPKIITSIKYAICQD